MISLLTLVPSPVLALLLLAGVYQSHPQSQPLSESESPLPKRHPSAPPPLPHRPPAR